MCVQNPPFSNEMAAQKGLNVTSPNDQVKPNRETDLVSELAQIAGPLVSGMELAAGCFDQPTVKEEAQLAQTTDKPITADSVAIKSELDLNVNQGHVASVTGTNDLYDRCKVPTLIDQHTWLHTEASGTLLKHYDVHPCTCMVTGKGASTAHYKMYHTSPMAMFSQYFNFWRGSIIFDIEVISAATQQGQLYVCYVPRDDAWTDVTYAAALNCNGVTLDISKENKVSFEVPFVSETAWKQCGNLEDTRQTHEKANGQLVVYVVNPLCASSSVSNQVEINFYIRSGGDFQFARPRGVGQNSSWNKNKLIEYYLDGAWHTPATINIQPRTEPSEKSVLEPREGIVRARRKLYDIEEQSRTASPAVAGSTGHSQAYTPVCGMSLPEVAVNKAADTESVFNQQYVISSGITIPSVNLGANIRTIKIPGDLINSDLAPSGLLDYHQFYRFDYEFEFLMQSNPFYQGMIVAYFAPHNFQCKLNPAAGDEAWYTPSSVMQLPHVFIGLSGVSSAKLVVPWATVFQMLSQKGSAATIGNLHIMGWNVLKYQTGGQTVNLSVKVRFTNPVVALRAPKRTYSADALETHLENILPYPVDDLKKALRAKKTPEEKTELLRDILTQLSLSPKKTKSLRYLEDIQEESGYQAEANATDDQQTIRTETMITDAGEVRGVFMEEDMSIYDLMKMAEPIFDLAVSRNAMQPLGTVAVWARGPLKGGFNHRLLEATYAFHSGGKRLHFQAACNISQSIIAGTHYRPVSYLKAWAGTGTAGGEGANIGLIYPGATVTWNPNTEQCKVVEFPQYSSTQLLMNTMEARHTADEDIDSGGEVLFFTKNSGSVDLNMLCFMSVMEDYRLYFPLPMPGLRYRDPLPGGRTMEDAQEEGPVGSKIKTPNRPKPYFKNNLANEKRGEFADRVYEFNNRKPLPHPGWVRHEVLTREDGMEKTILEYVFLNKPSPVAEAESEDDDDPPPNMPELGELYEGDDEYDSDLIDSIGFNSDDERWSNSSEIKLDVVEDEEFANELESLFTTLTTVLPEKAAESSDPLHQIKEILAESHPGRSHGDKHYNSEEDHPKREGGVDRNVILTRQRRTTEEKQYYHDTQKRKMDYDRGYPTRVFFDYFRCVETKNITLPSCILHLKDDLYVTPKHCVEATIYPSGFENLVELGNDHIVLKGPWRVGGYYDNMATLADFEKMVEEGKHEYEMEFKTIKFTGKISLDTCEGITSLDKDIPRHQMLICYCSDEVSTVMGDCGEPLMIEGKLAGLHRFSSTSVDRDTYDRSHVACSVPVYKEMFEGLFEDAWEKLERIFPKQWFYHDVKTVSHSNPACGQKFSCRAQIYYKFGKQRLRIARSAVYYSDSYITATRNAIIRLCHGKRMPAYVDKFSPRNNTLGEEQSKGVVGWLEKQIRSFGAWFGGEALKGLFDQVKEWASKFWADNKDFVLSVLNWTTLVLNGLEAIYHIVAGTPGLGARLLTCVTLGLDIKMLEQSAEKEQSYLVGKVMKWIFKSLFKVFKMPFTWIHKQTVIVTVTRMLTTELAKPITERIGKFFHQIWDYFFPSQEVIKIAQNYVRKDAPQFLLHQQCYINIAARCLDREINSTLDDLEVTHRQQLYNIYRYVLRVMPYYTICRDQAALTFFREVIALQRKVFANDKGSEMRTEPIGIFLTGAPGQGKSTLVTYLANAVLKRAGIVQPSANSDHEIYGFPTDPNQNHADGYIGQEWCYFDDTLASNEAPEATRIINLISESVCQVPMAMLEEKGRTFRSHFLCMTSNAETLDNIPDLRFPLALKRRISQFSLKVSATKHNPGAANQLLEWPRLEKMDAKSLTEHLQSLNEPTFEEIADVIDNYYWISKHDLSRNNGTAERIKFGKLVDDIVKEYRMRTKVTEIKKSLIKEMKIQPMPEQMMDAFSNFVFNEDKPAFVSYNSWDGSKGDSQYDEYAKTFDNHFKKTEEFKKEADDEKTNGPDGWWNKVMPEWMQFRCNPTVEALARGLKAKHKAFKQKMLDQYKRITDWGKFRSETVDERIESMRSTSDRFKKWMIGGLGMTALALLIGKWVINNFHKYLPRIMTGVQKGQDLASRAYTEFVGKVQKLPKQAYEKLKKIAEGEILALHERRKLFSALYDSGKINVRRNAALLQLLNEGRIGYRNHNWIPYYVLYPECEEVLIQQARENGSYDPYEHEYWVELLAGLDAAGEQSLVKEVRRARRVARGAEQSGWQKKGQPPVCRQMVELVDPLISTEDAIGYAIAVDDKHLLMNYHYKFERDIGPTGNFEYVLRKKLYFRKPGGTDDTLYCINVQDSKQVVDRNDKPLDLMIVKTVSMGMRSYISQFATYEDLERENSQTTVTSTLYRKGREPMPVIVDFEIQPQQSDNPYLNTWLITGVALEDTVAGDCGSVYIYKDKVIGMHSKIIDRKEHRVGIVQCARQDIEKCISEPTTIEADVKFEPVGEEQSWTGDGKGYPCVGKFRGKDDGKIMMNNLPLKNDRVRSEIAHPELWPDHHSPSRKSREILYKRSEKFCQRAVADCFTEEERAFALAPYTVNFGMNAGRRTTPLTDEEILNGTEQINELKIESSSGTWNEISKHKEAFVDVKYRDDGTKYYEWSDAYYSKVHPKFGVTLDEQIKTRELLGYQGVSMPVFWTASLKDELLPEEKIKLGKSRVFECPPIDSTLLFKKYFGAFSDYYRHFPGPIMSHTIGVEKEAVWKDLYVMLRDKNRGRVIAADFSQYDGSIQGEFFRHFESVTDIYYGDFIFHPQVSNYAHKAMRHALIYELQHTYILIGDRVMKTDRGNKSGQYMTDIFNSVTNVCAWMVAFHRNFKELHGVSPTLDDWYRDVVLFTHGDDCIGAVDSSRSGVTADRMVEHIRDLGFTITSACKDDSGKVIVPIEEATYLKSGFRVEGNPEYPEIVWPPMPKEVSYKEMNWVKKKWLHDLEVRNAMIAEAVKFMAWRGEEEYTQFVREIYANLACRFDFQAHPPNIKTFREIRADIWTRQMEEQFKPVAESTFTWTMARMYNSIFGRVPQPPTILKLNEE